MKTQLAAFGIPYTLKPFKNPIQWKVFSNFKEYHYYNTKSPNLNPIRTPMREGAGLCRAAVSNCTIGT